MVTGSSSRGPTYALQAAIEKASRFAEEDRAATSNTTQAPSMGSL